MVEKCVGGSVIENGTTLRTAKRPKENVACAEETDGKKWGEREREKARSESAARARCTQRCICRAMQPQQQPQDQQQQPQQCASSDVSVTARLVVESVVHRCRRALNKDAF